MVEEEVEVVMVAGVVDVVTDMVMEAAAVEVSPCSTFHTLILSIDTNHDGLNSGRRQCHAYQ
jgi:hypothetical protein